MHRTPFRTLWQGLIAPLLMVVASTVSAQSTAFVTRSYAEDPTTATWTGSFTLGSEGIHSPTDNLWDFLIVIDSITLENGLSFSAGIQAQHTCSTQCPHITDLGSGGLFQASVSGTGTISDSVTDAQAHPLDHADGFAFTWSSDVATKTVSFGFTAVHQVPEPSTWLMLFAGLGVVGGVSYSRRAR
jgi:hypothetical protein